jgi:hypothetical protein
VEREHLRVVSRWGWWGWGRAGCLQGVKGDCGAYGDDVDDDADGGCDEDGVDGDAEGRVHFREGVWEGVAAVASERPGMMC